MNSFGRLFRIHICGESHGSELAVIIDNCPAGIPLAESDFTSDLSRRRAGGIGTTQRREEDIPIIACGFFSGRTTGAPILLRFENRNIKSADYAMFRYIPRPGHADFTAGEKYGGFHDHRGGGHFSGRLTLLLVAAGVVAKKVISPVEVAAELIEAGGEENIGKAVSRAAEAQDSIGGIVECRVTGVPAGLGEPFFDSLESLVSHIIFSIPGIKGIEFGDGFRSARMAGSKCNDLIVKTTGKTATNHSGGINGGISNGNPIIFRMAVRPPASIPLPQSTINLKTGKRTRLKISGRHDLCFALRVPVVAEASLALVLADLLLLEQRRPRIWGKKETIMKRSKK